VTRKNYDHFPKRHTSGIFCKICSIWVGEHDPSGIFKFHDVSTEITGFPFLPFFAKKICGKKKREDEKNGEIQRITVRYT
jgi:hypothetical protein